MNKLWLIVLMVLFPLQAALAVVQSYAGPSHEGEIAGAALVHAHVQHHDDHHDQSSNGHHGDELCDAGCESDHNHCHAHWFSLPAQFYSAKPFSFSHTRPEIRTRGFARLTPSPIDKPNWV